MNYDGIAYVVNLGSTYLWHSEHGHAFVIDDTKDLLIDNYNWKTVNNSYIYAKHLKKYPNTLYTKRINISSKIGFRCNLFTKKTFINRLPSIRFNQIYKAQSIEDKCFGCFSNKNIIEYKKTNILNSNTMNYRFSTNVIDIKDKINNDKTFNPYSVNITDLSVVEVPDISNNGYEDLSIVIQKNCFTEIKLSENVTIVNNLPKDLEWSKGSIKGTMLQSGQFDIEINYKDNSVQHLNIIVPFYQRLL